MVVVSLVLRIPAGSDTSPKRRRWSPSRLLTNHSVAPVVPPIVVALQRQSPAAMPNRDPCICCSSLPDFGIVGEIIYAYSSLCLSSIAKIMVFNLSTHVKLPTKVGSNLNNIICQYNITIVCKWMHSDPTNCRR